jgi:hypothetical protein
VLGAVAVRQIGLPAVDLAGIHIGDRGRVDDEVGLVIADRIKDIVAPGDVELEMAQGHDLASALEALDEGPAQPARRARHERLPRFRHGDEVSQRAEESSSGSPPAGGLALPGRRADVLMLKGILPRRKRLVGPG